MPSRKTISGTHSSVASRRAKQAGHEQQAQCQDDVVRRHGSWLACCSSARRAMSHVRGAAGIQHPARRTRRSRGSSSHRSALETPAAPPHCGAPSSAASGPAAARHRLEVADLRAEEDPLDTPLLAGLERRSATTSSAMNASKRATAGSARIARSRGSVSRRRAEASNRPTFCSSARTPAGCVPLSEPYAGLLVFDIGDRVLDLERERLAPGEAETSSTRSLSDWKAAKATPTAMTGPRTVITMAAYSLARMVTRRVSSRRRSGMLLFLLFDSFLAVASPGWSTSPGSSCAGSRAARAGEARRACGSSCLNVPATLRQGPGAGSRRRAPQTHELAQASLSSAGGPLLVRRRPAAAGASIYHWIGPRS